MGSWALTLSQAIQPVHSVGLAGFTWQFPNWTTQASGQQAYLLDDIAGVQLDLTTGTWAREKVTQLVISLRCSVSGVFIPGVRIGVGQQALQANELIMDPTILAHQGGAWGTVRYCIFPLLALGEHTLSRTLTGRDLATDIFLLNGRVSSLADPRMYANGLHLGVELSGQTQPNALSEPSPVSMTVRLTALSFSLTTTPVYVDPDVGSGSGVDTGNWSSGWAKAA